MKSTTKTSMKANMKSAEIMIRVLQPYPGLRPFMSREADIFYGRGEQIDALLCTLEDNHVVAVVGASGSGKSSLVRAGLLPSLEAGFLSGAGPDWKMVLMRPGNAPFSQLAQALLRTDADTPADPHAAAFLEATLRSGPRGLIEAIRDRELPAETNVLLLVDQFEEIFRFRHQGRDDPHASDARNEATAFVNMLLATRAEPDLPFYGVITMRSDFLGDCDAFHGLPEAINDCQFLVPRLRRDQLSDTITGPLDLFGAAAEISLVNRILNEIGTNPDQLPLMQHMLLRMWLQAEKRAAGDDVVLQLSDYQAIGGLQHALSWHADEVFEELGDEGSKRVAELMFRCLCDQSAESRLTRRLVTVAQVAEVAGVDAQTVISVASFFLGSDRNFLTVSPSDNVAPASTLDISHEALIRQWDRLGEWVTAESQSASRYRRLLETAKLWKAGRASLLVSPELDIAVEWRNQERPTQAWASRYGDGFELSIEFLEASLAAQQSQLTDQRRDARRKTLWLIGTLAVVTSLMLVSVFLGWRSYLQTQDLNLILQHSQDQASKLNSLFVESQLSLGTASIRDGRMAEGLLRYSTAFDAALDDASRQSALELIAAWSQFAGRPFIHDSNVRQVAFGRNGETILTITDHAATIWDLRQGEPLTSKRSAGAEWQAIAIRPETLNVLIATDETAELWDLALGKSLSSLEHGETITSVLFSDDGQTVVTRGPTSLQIWDAQSGRPVGARWPIDGTLPFSLRANGQSFVVLAEVRSDGTGFSATSSGNPVLVDVESGKFTWIPAEKVAGEHRLAFSPNGKVVISVGVSAARLWKFAPDPGEAQTVTLHHDGTIRTVEFSGDSQLVLTGSNDNTARLWQVATGEPQLPRPLQHDGTVVSAKFGPGSRTVLTGSADNSARLWDVETGEPLSHPLRHAGTVVAAVFSKDGQTILTGSVDGAARLWQRRTRELLSDRFGGGEPFRVVALSPSGETAVGTNEAGLLALSTLGAKTVSTPFPDEVSVENIRFSPNGKWLLAHEGKTAFLWNVETASKRKPAFHHDAVIEAMAFGPDGKTVLIAGGDTAQLWAVDDAALPLQEFRHQTAIHAVAVSFDGRLIATGGQETAQIWEVSSGRPLSSPLEHGDAVLAVTFSLDGQLLATGSADNTASIWEVQSGALMVTPLAHRDAVSDVTFSPDAESLLTASLDTKARFWGVRSGELRGDPMSHRGQVKSARYHRNGQRAVTIDDTGAAWSWVVLPPSANERDRLNLSIVWRTGFEIDFSGEIRRLSQAEWLEQKRSLDRLGGPCDVCSWDDA